MNLITLPPTHTHLRIPTPAHTHSVDPLWCSEKAEEDDLVLLDALVEEHLNETTGENGR